MLVPAEVFTIAKTEQGDAVLIKPINSNIVVPIHIDPLVSDSILLGMKKVKILRPLTHELLINILYNLDVKVERIEITELKASTFYARLILNQNGNEISIDSRPSDCIAIHVRVNCLMYIDEHVVKVAGIPIDFLDNVDNELSMLKTKLNEAVEEENYEEAAIIRDKIKELEQKV